MTHLLQGVVDTATGTGHSARVVGLTGAAAGKTGTTDDTGDAWFIGYTPDIVAGVWVGHDSNSPTGLTGAQGALPIWTDFVRAVAGPDTPREFPVPDGIVWRSVDPLSGDLATPACPHARREPFLVGTEPHEPCTLHRPALTAVADRVGGVVRGGGRAVSTAGRAIRDWFSHLFR
jgi:penicillin-binding protein 1B